MEDSVMKVYQYLIICSLVVFGVQLYHYTFHSLWSLFAYLIIYYAMEQYRLWQNAPIVKDINDTVNDIQDTMKDIKKRKSKFQQRLEDAMKTKCNEKH